MKKYLLILLILLITNNLKLFSDEPRYPTIKNRFQIGIIGGYNYIMDEANMYNTTQIVGGNVAPCLCPTFDKGHGNGFFAGLALQYKSEFDNIFVVHIIYNNLPSHFSITGDLYPMLFDDPDHPGQYKTVLATTEQTLDVTYSLLNLDVLYKMNVFYTDFGIAIGPSFGFNLDNHEVQKYSLVYPNNLNFKRSDTLISKGYRYENNDRTIVVFDDKVHEISNMRVGLKVGLEYKFDLFGYCIYPSVYYNWALTKVNKNDKWYINYFQAGISIMYSI
jgi:hypothetical protein